MARRMSVALTKDQVIARTKDVTRRLGWEFAKAGDEVILVSRVMGFKKGETAEVYAIVKLREVRREPLNKITRADCVREGFPHLSPAEFVTMFCQHNKCTPDTMVTRIEWEYLF